MYSSTSLLLLLILLLLLLLPSFPTTLLESTCRSITSSRSDLSSDLCISSLSSDPSASSADLHGLALIATRLSIANATNTAARLHRLIDAGPQRKTSDCLTVCLDVYSDAVDHLNDSASAIESRNYNDAVTFLSAAMDAAENCEDAFGEEGMASSMADEDRRFEHLVKIALAIVSILR